MVRGGIVFILDGMFALITHEFFLWVFFEYISAIRFYISGYPAKTLPFSH